MMLWSLVDGLDELDYGKNIGGYLRHLYMKNPITLIVHTFLGHLVNHLDFLVLDL